MPLRDHFRSPLNDIRHWEGLYGAWPAMMVVSLIDTLPHRYAAAPRVCLDSPLTHVAADRLTCAAYEVRVFDTERGGRQVAAVELVCPSNKDRPEHRRAFIARCTALLQDRVSVVIVDVVTTCNFNLYGELLQLVGRSDPALLPEPPSLYGVALCATKKGDDWLLEAWAHPLGLGKPLPTLPLWLADNIAIPLELEQSYEETCRVLRIA